MVPGFEHSLTVQASVLSRAAGDSVALVPGYSPTTANWYAAPATTAWPSPLAGGSA
jgi:hypothetical protein